jgi:hypothetical protein
MRTINRLAAASRALGFHGVCPEALIILLQLREFLEPAIKTDLVEYIALARALLAPAEQEG